MKLLLALLAVGVGLCLSLPSWMLIWNAAENEERYRIAPIRLKYYEDGAMSWTTHDPKNYERDDGTIFVPSYESGILQDIREGKKPRRTRALSWWECQWFYFKHWWKTGETQKQSWAYFMGNADIRMARWNLEYQKKYRDSRP